MTTATSAYERIVDALRDTVPIVKDNGRQATANCPAHEDRSPSLSIRAIEGQALLHCHAGCRTDDVLAALNLTMADLFDEPRGATYRYDDGRIVHRSPAKKFTQTGITSTEGGTQLYRLDQITAAVRDKVPVYWVEGEKDVHALESLGAVATTAPMGAGNVGKVDAMPLASAHVIAVPDQDKAGIQWQQVVLDKLAQVGAIVKIGTVRAGKDAADHIAAGHGLDEIALSDPPAAVAPMGLRAIRLTKASEIPIRPVRWVWKDRLALGSLALIGGREGIGKSTIAYTLAAAITRGRLPGIHHGQPRAVIVAATEDSWSHTIVPRLIAASADLELVYRVDVITSEGAETGLILPKDIGAVQDTLRETDAAMLLLDPLMSRLDGNLDSHKDADVRRALEPFAALADRTGALFLGIIHVNKSANTDPLTLLMGSRAFAAVARAVLFVMKDGEDETLRLLGQPKNNLGRNDLPMLTFRIEGQCVAETEEGPVWTSVVSWQGERNGSVDEALNIASGTSEERTAVGDAKEWIVDYLTSLGGMASSADIKQYGKKAGHSEASVTRARTQLKLVVERVKASPPFSYWSLPDTQPASHNGSKPYVSPEQGKTGTETLDPYISPVGESARNEMNDLYDMYAGQSVEGVEGETVNHVNRVNISSPPAREVEPPVCDDCGWPIDSVGHGQACEGSS